MWIGSSLHAFAVQAAKAMSRNSTVVPYLQSKMVTWESWVCASLACFELWSHAQPCLLSLFANHSERSKVLACEPSCVGGGALKQRAATEPAVETLCTVRVCAHVAWVWLSKSALQFLLTDWTGMFAGEEFPVSWACPKYNQCGQAYGMAIPNKYTVSRSFLLKPNWTCSHSSWLCLSKLLMPDRDPCSTVWFSSYVLSLMKVNLLVWFAGLRSVY